MASKIDIKNIRDSLGISLSDHKAYQSFHYSVEREREFRIRYKDWCDFLSEKFFERLLSGMSVYFGPYIGIAELYKTNKMTDYLVSGATNINWKKTMEEKERVFHNYHPFSMYRYRLKTITGHGRTKFFAYPIFTKAYRKKLSSAVQNEEVTSRIRLATRHSSSFRDWDHRNYNHCHSIDIFTKRIVSDSANVLGLPSRETFQFYKALTENLAPAIEKECKKKDRTLMRGVTFLHLLLFSFHRTDARYKQIDDEWTGQKPFFQSIEKDPVGLRRDRKRKNLKYSSKSVLNIARLCKREAPERYLDTEKTIEWTFSKLLSVGEINIPYEYVSFVLKRFHKPHIVRRAWIYN